MKSIELFTSHILHICILFAFDEFYLMIYFYLFIVKKDGGKHPMNFIVLFPSLSDH